MAKYIRIGEPANEAEREGFRLLRDQLPDHYLVLGNFSLRLPQRRTSLEFDAVVIGEYGFFAVEIKGWTGMIRGGESKWLLPWGRVSNPISYLDKKTKALAQFVRQKIPNLPDDCFYQPGLFFPRRGVQFELPQNLMSSIIGPDGIYEYFVDMDLVRQKGPGPFRERDTSRAVVDAIVTSAAPSDQGVFLSYYDVEGELDRKEFPYREYVGKHEYLKSRSKVRIKAYAMDGLASKANLRGQQNRVLRDMEALEVLDDNRYVARSYEMQPDYKDDLIFYLVSEWVGPQTLREFLDQRCGEEHSQPEVYRLCHHLIEAVVSIHEIGIVHRNLSPSVIYLPEDSSVPLKIADFDFARVTQLDTIADALSHIGTNGYTAPEIWMEADYDHRVDIFAVGAIIFEILTSKMLFSGPGSLLQPIETWQAKADLIDDERIRNVVYGMVATDMEPRDQAMEEAQALFAMLCQPEESSI